MESIRSSLLENSGLNTTTGGLQESSWLLCDYGLSDATLYIRSTKVGKFLSFCDENNRCPFPSDELYFLAYIVFLLLAK